MVDGDQRALSAAARSVWAKTRFDREDPDATPEWMPLWRHLDDSAAVAGKLWDEWLPDSVRRVISAAVDGDEARARRLVVWLAGVHDVGKATPAFAVQSPALADAMTRAGLPVQGPYADRRELRHELAGVVCLTRWLGQRHGWSEAEARRLAVVVGGHHGVAPTLQQVRDAPHRSALLGSGRWTEVQDEHLDRQVRLLADGDLTGPIVPSQPAQVLMTAVVILADWIASNADLFGYDLVGRTEQRLAAAWEALELPAPWVSRPGSADVDELVARRFGFTGAARPVQAVTFATAASLDDPGLIVVEGPMGEGKTEAALLAAEVLAERTGAGGCFVALPTQATTDAMFGRVRAWMDTLPGTGPLTVHLAHGKASLNDKYRGLMLEGRVTAVAIDEDAENCPGQRTEGSGFAPLLPVTAVVHEWLQGRKKGVLASFVVGTVDQTLFSALKSRHLVLRHLALASKVVVIDEVHAYDVYMSSYLDRTLHWLGAYGVPVVLLSATLPARRREEMVAAYRSGRAALEGRTAAETEMPDQVDYPLITATSGTDLVVRSPTPASGRRSEVRVDRIDDDLESLARLLEESLADGGCALVVRNTVTRVQETGRFLAERFGADEVTVVHARFLAVDRAANDADLLRRFGRQPDSRPSRHIVVGSQVVEQSLDVDFDLLVTDLAPVDLVLQRMGRLHRHDRGPDRPAGVRTPRCVLTGVDWTATPPRPVRGSCLVYEEEALLRSLAVLRPHLDGGGPVALPDHIATLVQAAYGDGVIGPDDWQPALAEAHGKAVGRAAEARRRARTFQLAEVDRSSRALLNWVQAGVGDVDDGPGGEAQVRDGAMSLEVLVVVRDDDGLVVPPWVTPERVLLDTNLEIRGAQARLVASCSLRLPLELSAPHVIDATIADLEAQCWVSAWQRSPLLAGQLVLALDRDGRAQVAGRDLHYSRTHGLEVRRP